MRHLLHARLRRVLIGTLLTAPVVACWAAEPAPVTQPSSTRTEAAEAGDALAPTLPYGAGYERRRRAGRTSPELPWPPSANDSPTPADDTTATTGVGNARGNGGSGNGNGNSSGSGSNGNGRGGRGGRR